MASFTEKPEAKGAPSQPFVDPLGRPIYQGNPRFTDQQAGGDLTGDESDARDGNYVESATGQNGRDVSAHADEIPAASSELLRYVAAVVDLPDKAAPSAPIEPDGTEDPGANADDGLMPGKDPRDPPKSR